MRKLILAALLVPTCAFAADDTRITATIEFSSYRVRPSPEPGHNHVTFNIILHPDGSVDDSFAAPGRFSRKGTVTGTLGERYRVIDNNAIRRTRDFKDRIETVTITVTGKSCRATMTNELKPGFSEFEAPSVALGTNAFYRNWKMTSSTCSIS